MKQIILSVLGKDKPGIVAAVSKSLYQDKINLEDVSMTILEGEFAMMLVIKVSVAKYKKAKERLEKICAREKIICQWTEIKNRLSRGSRHKKGMRPYVISVFGKDKTGIVYKSTEILAKLKLNITDLNSKILGAGSKSVYMMLIEIDVPPRFKLIKLDQAFKRMTQSLKVDYAINPVNAVNG